MIPELRKQFNESFSDSRYQSFLQDLHSRHPGAIEFRVAETPVFVPKEFSQKLVDACETIIDIIKDPDFIKFTETSIPSHERVPKENGFPHMIAFDFGVCINESGILEPQLIEMQGFPTLFGFQVYYPEVLRRHFDIPSNFTHYLDSYNKDSYIEDLKQVIVDGMDPESVILLEIRPHEQKTRIDFYCTRDYLGIQPVDLTELIQEGRKLFYMYEGKKIQVKRIYNRIIFDDLKSQTTLGEHVDITQDFDVEWIPHPNWFYRVSKFTLPSSRDTYPKVVPAPCTYFPLTPGIRCLVGVSLM